jgi:oxygen-independent coproporphyrinogen-3 oxidase
VTETASSAARSLPPLALYLHVPWCVRKCPYCDFNSHAAEAPPFEQYVTRVLKDLDQELADADARRPLVSVFIGGGTPSLLPDETIARLMAGIAASTGLESEIEVTLEANPGTLDARRCMAYRAAGVNRLSLGAQSLSPTHLQALGRIHGATEIRDSVRDARRAGFDNLNLDLMFALPDQGIEQAKQDLDALIALEPDHISYYQLTLEPNTRWHAAPPALPDADAAADMAEQGIERLTQAGYRQYEVSAFARPGARCRHNLNYWQFGDYLGVGAGAHGKLTRALPEEQGWEVRRTTKPRQPSAYLRDTGGAPVGEAHALDEAALVLEFALNGLRLIEGVDRADFTRTTGLPWSRIEPIVRRAAEDGMLACAGNRVVPTALGRRFLDDLVQRFAGH